MRLAELAEVSAQVAQTSKRTQKVALLASSLNQQPSTDRTLRVMYLAGQLTQPKLGVGPAQILALSVPPASAGSLELSDVDSLLSELAAARGPGVTERRAGLLTRLWGAATDQEQRFLRRLLL